MLEPLIEYINQRAQTHLSTSDIALLREVMVFKRYKKKQFLLQDGDVCKNLSFILKGATRQYSVDEKGNEHIMALCIEGWWTGDRESYFRSVPSVYNIDAWEETEVLMLPKTELPRVSNIPAFAEMRMTLDENYSIAAQKRVLVSISHSAEKRFEELAKTYPEFLQRFPQHIVASYLGITKETLSRIRSQAARK
ncbi:Crp/Fnr family transcriptional regulator [Mucilaginibacter limnophilus]|uniref:Crp/Fnr family transcriptional regulator n=1 Tax=Mucilaginibacter limnophilus TaxID=1932778 RepID=A0A437MHW0_9SPHI|nr:Crp/Fnr family transcriptional regulator [Mucilaginibacter limnophilus]RVT97229.1 Crp/Fnr family transcriptional regulator [Mucilaginibacter limnophilus]